MPHGLFVADGAGEASVRMRIGEAGDPVVANSLVFQAVLWNGGLTNASNAVHAVSDLPPEAPRLVRVSTERKKNYVVLRVADSGPGISEELLPRIFDPFVTTKAPGKGTGLGRAITFPIVEGHAVTIGV